MTMEHRCAERLPLQIEAVVTAMPLEGRYAVRNISAEGLCIDASSEVFDTSRIASVLLRDPLTGTCSPPMDMFVVHRNGPGVGLMSINEPSGLGEFIRSLSSAAAKTKKPLPGSATGKGIEAIRTQEKAA
jgi:hypothetical protein